MPQPLTDDQRKAIHDFALDARELLTGEAQELLEGTYGLYPDGHLDRPGKLPQVQGDPETGATYRRLAQFLKDEERAGQPRPEAVIKLVKEVAFTHLNRLVAFKMMEARKLIRGTVDRGTDSNAYKFYLADPGHAEDYALYQAGDVDTAYRHFLLWQSAQIAAEVRVLFDPDTLPSRLFPRPRALNALLEMLNAPKLSDIWRADETIGWIYQFFNEREKAEVDERVNKQKQKIRRQDIPAATQLFTPHWIVRFLVQNTLGRLWVQMHPDTRLTSTELLDYLVPLRGDISPESLRPIREVTLLDPACGTMHFGLVAFDLFAAMYQEELERTGEPGWPLNPSVSGAAEIPAAIIQHNLYGIDIDLRAVQLSALALHLKAKTLNPKARIAGSNLACADVLPLNGARLGTFLREARFTRPIYERLIRALWERLKDVNQLGSLLRLEKEIGELIAEERARYQETPLFAGLKGEFERNAAEQEFWDILSAQIVQGLDHFAREHAAAGIDQRFFTGEATKGLRLLDLMLRRYGVVVTNPPYRTKRDLNEAIANYLIGSYPDAKGDLYAAFIQRCGEWVEECGRLGMITQQSFMFISSYKQLRAHLRGRFAIEAMVHTGPHAFAEIKGEKVNTTIFVLRVEPDTARRESSVGTYFRLVKASEGNGKRQAFEQALQDEDPIYCVTQHRFDAIPRRPWVYWIPQGMLDAFERYHPLETAEGTDGHKTADNNRFIRYAWELSSTRDGIGHAWRQSTRTFEQVRYGYCYGQVVDWSPAAHYFYSSNASSSCLGEHLWGKGGVSWSRVASHGSNARRFAPAQVPDVATPAVYPETATAEAVLVAVLNSSLGRYILALLNPTINYALGDVRSFPLVAFPAKTARELETLVCDIEIGYLVHYSVYEIMAHFASPPNWLSDISELDGSKKRLVSLEQYIDGAIYRLYGIGDEDRAAIEAELAGGVTAEGDDGDETPPAEDEEAEEPEAPMTREELAVRWISYAVGIVLGRFQPGVAGTLGSATYQRADFAIGSLPEPDEAGFDELVGTPERFAYIDTDGGRHLFSSEVEAALRDLALPDGTAVLDEGHPRDLPALAERALALMLGEESAQEVITEGAGGDLRRFLERRFFTTWHSKWYRKRPVYWPLQSAKRNYGFVLFHERIDKSTLYTLQRDYLDHKLNGLRLEIGDLQGRLEGSSGSARRQVERQIDKATQLLDEVSDFAQTMERVVREGYEPEPNWIDDGVILRMAPLWELIPIWKAEPEKYWERLQRGDYDWSHIAMHYWPERVREKCKGNKSYAIAHGHEEWYEET